MGDLDVANAIGCLLASKGQSKFQIVLVLSNGTTETLGGHFHLREDSIELTSHRLIPFEEIQAVLKREICDFQGCLRPAATPRLKGVQACDDHIDWWDTEIERPERDE